MISRAGISVTFHQSINQSGRFNSGIITKQPFPFIYFLFFYFFSLSSLSSFFKNRTPYSCNTSTAQREHILRNQQKWITFLFFIKEKKRLLLYRTSDSLSRFIFPHPFPTPTANYKPSTHIPLIPWLSPSHPIWQHSFYLAISSHLQQSCVSLLLDKRLTSIYIIWTSYSRLVGKARQRTEPSLETTTYPLSPLNLWWMLCYST